LAWLEPDIAASARIGEIRKQIESMLTNLPNFAHAVKFEFPPDRAADMRLSNEILNAVETNGDLLFSMGTWPHGTETGRESERLTEIRDSIENGMRGLARRLEEGSEVRRNWQRTIEAGSVEPLPSETPISVAKAIDNFRELQMACDAIANSTE